MADPVQFRNLVFEGGGVKGIAYNGALRALERYGALGHVTRVGGTSAGAINALIMALGYSHEEQRELMDALDFRELLDNSFGVLRDAIRLVTRFGWNRGDFFTRWIGDVIADPLGAREATFDDLRARGGPALYVVGANLTTGYSEVFSAERHGAMALARAVRISMSIPLLYAAVRDGERRDLYVDGGMILNYPVKLFDREKYIDLERESYAARRADYYVEENERFNALHPGRSPYVYNRQTLGLRVDTREEIGLYRYDEPIRGRPIRRLHDYGLALLGTLMNVQENQHLHDDDWHRTVYIDSGDVRTTDFDLSETDKQGLIDRGEAGVEEYFRWFDDPAESPWNRVGEPALQGGGEPEAPC